MSFGTLPVIFAPAPNRSTLPSAWSAAEALPWPNAVPGDRGVKLEFGVERAVRFEPHHAGHQHAR